MALIRATIATGVFSDALVAGLNAGMGIMKRRIFNQSQAVDGTSFGKYKSEPYKKKRAKRGRQIARKDLEVDGTIRRSIEVVTVNNTKAEVRFTNDESAKIAGYQEIQIFNVLNGLPVKTKGKKIEIFKFNQTERDISRQTTRDLIKQRFTF